MQNSETSAGAAPITATTPEIAYHGRFRETWALAFRLTLLTLATLGIYRFWAKARIRRYFWSRIAIDGERLEYSGTGLELFLGFLIVIAILAPLYGAMALAQLYFAASPAIAAAFSSIPAFIILVLILVLILVAVFRARRYRLSRTVWRGVRAGQSRSTWGYWGRALGYGAVGWFTLGLMRPLAHLKLTRYLMNHTWVGQNRFRFAAALGPLMSRWLLAWVLLLLTFGGYMGAIAVLIAQTQSKGAPLDLQNLSQAQGGLILAGGGAFVFLWIGWLLAYVRYNVFRTRYFVAATLLDGLAFASRLRFRRVFGIYLIASLAYFLPLATAVASGFAIGVAFDLQHGPLVGMALAVFLSATMIAPFVTHPLLRHFVDALEITGAVDLDRLSQSREPASRTGEGLASAFDVDAF